jgi:hypothetical protein
MDLPTCFNAIASNRHVLPCRPSLIGTYTMNPELKNLFDEPENAYLSTDELNALGQFVSSLPDRISLYRRLRNEEVNLMQPVADQLQAQFSQESEETLKRSLQNAILMLRYAAMAMLTDDDSLVTKRLESWLPDIVAAYETQAIEQRLYQLIRTQLSGRFSTREIELMTPGLDAAQALIANSAPMTEDDAEVTGESLVSLFK